MNFIFFRSFWTIFDLFFWTCTVPVSKANFSASIAASVKAFVSDGQAKKPFVLQITLQSYDASRARWPADVSLFSPNCLSNTMGRELFSKEFFCLYEINWILMLKLRYSEEAKKFEKFSHFVLKLLSTAKRILETLGIQTSSSFVKIW